MSAVRCGCPAVDSVACIEMRYPNTRHEDALEEPCECLCHDVDEDEEDLESLARMGHRLLYGDAPFMEPDQ